MWISRFVVLFSAKKVELLLKKAGNVHILCWIFRCFDTNWPKIIKIVDCCSRISFFETLWPKHEWRHHQTLRSDVNAALFLTLKQLVNYKCWFLSSAFSNFRKNCPKKCFKIHTSKFKSIRSKKNGIVDFSCQIWAKNWPKKWKFVTSAKN